MPCHVEISLGKGVFPQGFVHLIILIAWLIQKFINASRWLIGTRCLCLSFNVGLHLSCVKVLLHIFIQLLFDNASHIRCTLLNLNQLASELFGFLNNLRDFLPQNASGYGTVFL